MRESRLGQGQPGSDWSSAERESWELDCLGFLKGRSDGDATSQKAKKQKTQDTAEHLASYDELMSWGNATIIWTGEGLQQFRHVGDLDTTTLPQSIFLTLDWVQTQWRCVWFLKHHAHLNLDAFFDLTHRR